MTAFPWLTLNESPGAEVSSSELPSPLVEPGTNLRDYKFMPIEIGRLQRSRAWLIAKRTPELGFYMINLWMAAWHEVPAGSLEDDDIVLADAAMCSPKRWPKIRDDVMRHWVKCSDGRLYHPVVCEKAREAWTSKRKNSLRASAGGAGKWHQGAKGSANRLLRHERLSEARKLGTHTKEEWVSLLDVCDHACVRCGDEPERLVKDHITPIYQGGSDSIANLQPLCSSCNLSKGPEKTDFRQSDWREKLAESLEKTHAYSRHQAGISGVETPANRSNQACCGRSAPGVPKSRK